MNFRYLYIIVAFTALVMGEAGARSVYNINARWTFFTNLDTDTAGAAVIYLPYTWNNDAAASASSYYRGVGNYAKDMDIPAEWQGSRVFIRVGGAATTCDVFVNGRLAGAHYGGNSAFTFELTGLLRYGKSNNFRIVANNSPTPDVLPTAGEENIYGGVFRGVELIVCDPLSVSPTADGADGIAIVPTRIADNRAEGTVRLSLLDITSIPAGGQATVRFIDADEKVASESSVPVTGSGVVSVPFSIARPHLWQGTADPYLYDVEVRLTSEAGTTDSLVVRTGLRTVGVDKNNNILLNGRPMKLCGVILHRDRMMVGSAVTPFQLEEDVSLIREMGANAVRVAGGQHCNYFYELCDEAGLLVWNDGPFMGPAYPTDIDFVDTDRFRGNGRAQLQEMIAQIGTHPCVVMWGLFSDVSTKGDNPVPFVRELNDLAHKLDPTRLTVGSSVQNGDINFVTDLILFNQSFGWGSGMPDAIKVWAAQLAKGWPGLHAGLSFSAGGSIFHQSEHLVKPSPQSNHHPEGWQTFFHEEYVKNVVDTPQFWGIFVSEMFDFGAARNTWGGGRGINNHGLVTFDRKDRKDAFYLYKANWNAAEPFVWIAGKRLDVRTDRRQTITVYSNAPEVELIAGGRTMGKKAGAKGIFKWEGLTLRGGINRLEARAAVSGAGAGSVSAGTVSDRATITVDPSVSTSGLTNSHKTTDL